MIYHFYKTITLRIFFDVDPVVVMRFFVTNQFLVFFL